MAMFSKMSTVLFTTSMLIYGNNSGEFRPVGWIFGSSKHWFTCQIVSHRTMLGYNLPFTGTEASTIYIAYDDQEMYLFNKEEQKLQPLVDSLVDGAKSEMKPEDKANYHADRNFSNKDNVVESTVRMYDRKNPTIVIAFDATLNTSTLQFRVVPSGAISVMPVNNVEGTCTASKAQI